MATDNLIFADIEAVITTGFVINQDFWIKESLVVINNVPVGICPQCGEKVVKAAVGQQIANLLARSKEIQPIRSINVPVIEFKQVA